MMFFRVHECFTDLLMHIQVTLGSIYNRTLSTVMDDVDATASIYTAGTNAPPEATYVSSWCACTNAVTGVRYRIYYKVSGEITAAKADIFVSDLAGRYAGGKCFRLVAAFMAVCVHL